MQINATKIRILYATRLMTQAELADAAGISRVTLNVILRRGTCLPDSLVKIAKVLRVEPKELLMEGE
ncbi:MAG: helix-turn-helix transcriptional regulator [Ruminococcaceae bacterium]|nr:helix-turn-helix transcriptional regulator [Oscillospiraceae bacterium]